MSIDSVISARAAAWIAIMEQSCAEKLPLAWSPVLFLAGRETAARKLWQEHASSNRFASTNVPGLWTLWLGKPTRKEVFLRATEPVNWGMMMAMLVYEADITDSQAFVAEMIEPLRGSAENLVGLHNYGPYFAFRSSVQGGHILNGLFPFFQRHAFADLLLKLPADDKTFAAHKEKIRSVADALPKELKDTGNLDASLFGFKEFAPLAKLGRVEGVGPLVPVAAVSTRDLLNYGWESTGLQMGARYRFVNRRWGVPELARPIYRNVTMEVEGLQPFYNTQEQANTYNYPATLARLQLVEGLFDFIGWSPSPFIPKAGEKEGARQFARRCWLRTRDFEWHARSLWDGDDLPEVTRYMEELRDEGGPLAAVEVIQYLFQIDPKDRTNIAKADPLLHQMAAKLPETSQAHRNAVYTAKYGTNNPFITAQILEGLYWQDIESGLEETIFNHYMMADAYKSARRFFMQTRPYIIDPILVSNRRGGIAFILGYLSNDEELRVAALKAGRSGSEWDLILQIWDAAIREDAMAMKRTASDLVERYETRSGPKSRGRRLVEFVPLLPALKDPKHPRRAEALEFFADGVQWVTLRWIWTTQYKMPKEDAIALLGGRETDAFRHVVVCCLEGDASAAKEALREYSKPRRVTEQHTIANYLVRQLEGKTFGKPETDLKPAEVTSTREAVLARLKARGPGGSQ